VSFKHCPLFTMSHNKGRPVTFNLLLLAGPFWTTRSYFRCFLFRTALPSLPGFVSWNWLRQNLQTPRSSSSSAAHPPFRNWSLSCLHTPFSQSLPHSTAIWLHFRPPLLLEFDVLLLELFFMRFGCRLLCYLFCPPSVLFLYFFGLCDSMRFPS